MSDESAKELTEAIYTLIRTISPLQSSLNNVVDELNKHSESLGADIQGLSSKMEDLSNTIGTKEVSH